MIDPKHLKEKPGTYGDPCAHDGYPFNREPEDPETLIEGINSQTVDEIKDAMTEAAKYTGYAAVTAQVTFHRSLRSPHDAVPCVVVSIKVRL